MFFFFVGKQKSMSATSEANWYKG